MRPGWRFWINSGSWSSAEWIGWPGWRGKEEQGMSDQSEASLLKRVKQVTFKTKQILIWKKKSDEILKSLTRQHQHFHIFFSAGVRNTNTHKVLQCVLWVETLPSKSSHRHFISSVCAVSLPAGGTPGSTVQRRRGHEQSGTAAVSQAGWCCLLLHCYPSFQMNHTLAINTITKNKTLF